MTPDPIEQTPSQKAPCQTIHESPYLHWRNQGNGYNYFFCQSCDYIKFDFETGLIKEIISTERARREEAEDKAKKQGIYACEMFDEVKRLQSERCKGQWEAVSREAVLELAREYHNTPIWTPETLTNAILSLLGGTK